MIIFKAHTHTQSHRTFKRQAVASVNFFLVHLILGKFFAFIELRYKENHQPKSVSSVYKPQPRYFWSIWYSTVDIALIYFAFLPLPRRVVWVYNLWAKGIYERNVCYWMEYTQSVRNFSMKESGIQRLKTWYPMHGPPQAHHLKWKQMPTKKRLWKNFNNK